MLRRAAASCRGCPLYACGTQVVFGDGPRDAPVMFVGEQPGDQEDRAGRPFVGPSGALLDAALGNSEVSRAEVYVTNAVKHFKWEPAPRGPRRIHKTPSWREVQACRPWLEAEIEVVQPRLIVALGATAARSLLGTSFRVSTSRGTLQQMESGARVIATVHPSAVLRTPSGQREAAEREFTRDIQKAMRHASRA